MYQSEVFNQKYWWVILRNFLDLTVTWDINIFYDCTNFAFEKSLYSWWYYHIIPDSSNFLVFSLDYPLSSFYPNLMKLRTPFSFLQIIFKEYFYLDRGRWHCFTNWLIKLASWEGGGGEDDWAEFVFKQLGSCSALPYFPIFNLIWVCICSQEPSLGNG